MVVLKDNDEFARDKLSVRRKLKFDIDDKNDKKNTNEKSLSSLSTSSNYSKYLEDLIKEKSLLWNFDFKNGVPMSGRYHWIKVKSYPLPEIMSVTKLTTFNNTNTNLSFKIEKSNIGKISVKKMRQTHIKDFYKTTTRNNIFSSLSKDFSTPQLPTTSSNSSFSSFSFSNSFSKSSFSSILETSSPNSPSSSLSSTSLSPPSSLPSTSPFSSFIFPFPSVHSTLQATTLVNYE